MFGKQVICGIWLRSDNLIQKCSAQALALCLFLITVGDADGLSYYSDGKVAGLLSMDPPQLAAARNNLIAAGLIAWQAPLYQVLSLQPELTLPPPSSPCPQPEPEEPSGCDTGSRSIGEILADLQPSSAHASGGEA